MKIRNGFVSNSSSSSFIISTDDFKSKLFNDYSFEDIIFEKDEDLENNYNVSTIIEYLNSNKIYLEYLNDIDYYSTLLKLAICESKNNRNEIYFNFDYIPKKYHKYFNRIKELIFIRKQLKIYTWTDLCKRRVCIKLKNCWNGKRNRKIESKICKLSDKIYELVCYNDFNDEITKFIIDKLLKEYNNKVCLFTVGSDDDNNAELGSALEYYLKLKCNNKFLVIENNH